MSKTRSAWPGLPSPFGSPPETSPPSGAAPAPSVQCSGGDGTSIPDSTGTPISMASTSWDRNSPTAQHSNTLNPERLTCHLDGIYLLTATVDWPASAHNAGRRSLQFIKNGTDYMQGDERIGSDSGEDWRQTASIQVPLVAGDYMSLNVAQTSGFTLPIGWAQLSMTRIA